MSQPMAHQHSETAINTDLLVHLSLGKNCAPEDIRFTRGQQLTDNNSPVKIIGSDSYRIDSLRISLAPPYNPEKQLRSGNAFYGHYPTDINFLDNPPPDTSKKTEDDLTKSHTDVTKENKEALSNQFFNASEANKMVADARGRKGLKKAEIARLLGMNQSNYDRLENGKTDNPRILTMNEIAVALGGHLEMRIVLPDEAPELK